MRQLGHTTAGLLALALLCQAGFADSPKPDDKVDRKAIDAALFGTLRDVINKGADMYNNGDIAGCYRLFEGALMTAKPMLDHRPELQKIIARDLTAANRDAVAFRRAFTLRASLDKVRAELNPNPKKPEEKKPEEKKPEEKKPEEKKPETKGELLPLPKTDPDDN